MGCFPPPPLLLRWRRSTLYQCPRADSPVRKGFPSDWPHQPEQVWPRCCCPAGPLVLAPPAWSCSLAQGVVGSPERVQLEHNGSARRVVSCRHTHNCCAAVQHFPSLRRGNPVDIRGGQFRCGVRNLVRRFSGLRRCFCNTVVTAPSCSNRCCCCDCTRLRCARCLCSSFSSSSSSSVSLDGVEEPHSCSRR